MHFVDTNTLDRAWSKGDPGYYIPRGGGGAEIGGRRAGFVDFTKKGKKIQPAQLHVDETGRNSFIDGRHRTNVMRDAGMAKIPVVMDPRSARHARTHGLIPPHGVN